MNSWKVILATLVIFGAGLVTGALLTRSSRTWYPPRKGASANTATNLVNRDYKLQPPLSGPLRKDFLDRLDKELKLSPQQRERIEKIISEGQENTRTLWNLVEPDIHAEMVGCKVRIRQELTPEQSARFVECFKKRTAKPAAKTPSAQLLTNTPPVP